MKYKILVVGNNASIINDLFLYKDMSLDFITSSIRYDDIRNHVKYLNPDMLLYCMGTENAESAGTIANIRRELLKTKIPVAIICEPPEKGFKYSDFPGGAPKLLMFRPITASEINARIIHFLENPGEEQVATPEAAAERSIASHTTKKIENEDIEYEKGNEKEEVSNKKRILVVDDAPNMLKIINNLLDSKYEVATAVSGKVALKFLAKKPVDLILLDYEMPDEDGPTVLQQIRSIPEFSNTPVIFLTGINDVSKIQKALALKPQGYLLKPIDQKKLIDRIAELID